MSKQDTRTVACRRCETELGVSEDLWWSHRWNEEPAKEIVERAIEKYEFRDWVQENFILCNDCHKLVIEVIDE